MLPTGPPHQALWRTSCQGEAQNTARISWSVLRIKVRYGSKNTMKEGQDVAHRATTPSTLAYFLSGRSAKNTWARVITGSHSSLEMLAANEMRG